MNIQFADNLRFLRKEAHLTQQALADRLQTTQSKIFYWESGKVEPDIESLWKLADLFCVAMDELVGRTDF